MRMSAPALMAGLMTVAAGPVAADSIIETTYRAVIDATRSTITYDRGGFDFIFIEAPPFGFIGSPEPAASAFAQPTAAAVMPKQVSAPLSGSFDVIVSEYRWDALAGSVQTWVRPANADIDYVLDGVDALFQLPTFFNRLTDGAFDGQDGPCNFPFPPDTSCSGWVLGMPATYSGTLDGGTLTMSGRTGAFSLLDPYFFYTIVASVTPLPAEPVAVLAAPPTACVLAVGLLGLFWQRGGRRRSRAGTRGLTVPSRAAASGASTPVP